MFPSAKQRIELGDLAVRFLVEAEDSNGTATMFECHVPAGKRMPAPHSHDGFEETVYGLEGVTTFTIDGETVEIGVGDAVCIPRGAVHGFENLGTTEAKFLAVASPGVFGPDYFLEVSELLAASAGGPPDMAAIAALMGRHGLTPVPPERRTRPRGPDRPLPRTGPFHEAEPIDD